MKKIWETKAPNSNSIVEFTMWDSRKLVGYYHGYNKYDNSYSLGQVNFATGKYKKLVIKVKKSNVESGRVIKW
jgi:hypothetical protein